MLSTTAQKSHCSLMSLVSAVSLLDWSIFLAWERAYLSLTHSLSHLGECLCLVQNQMCHPPFVRGVQLELQAASPTEHLPICQANVHIHASCGEKKTKPT